MALPVKTSAFLRETGDIADFTGRFFTQVFKPRYEITGFVRQCFLIGYKSRPLIGLTGFIMAWCLPCN